ncbi:MAG: hypothetical protein V1867_06755 [Candidatus Falkowbacteria bacterium]
MSLDNKKGKDKLFAFEINNIMNALRQMKQNIIDLNGGVLPGLTGIFADPLENESKTDTLKDYVDSQADAGQKDVNVGNGAQFAAGDAVILYDGAGTFETAVIASVSSNVLTMTVNLSNTYPEGSRIGRYLGLIDTANHKFVRSSGADLGNGSDGAFVSSGSVTWSSEKNFTSVLIQSGHTVTISGNFPVKCQGSFIIEAGGKLSAKGQGYSGGGGSWTQSYQGASYPGSGSASTSPNGGGGGGGSHSGNACGAGGGGGYGSGGGGGSYYASSAVSGQGGGVYNNPALSDTFTIAYLKGSGGGGGSSNWTTRQGSSGGSGGGIIRLHCQNLLVEGEIDCDGNVGGNGAETPPSGYYTCGGGGGGGGTIFICCAQLAMAGTNLIHANGGAGSYGKDGSGNPVYPGGGGGNGRIRIEAAKITGSTSPAYGSGYVNDTGFCKYGWYFTNKINTLNPVITVNCYVKQEINFKVNIAAVSVSGQPDIEVADSDGLEAGDVVLVLESDKMEIKEIEVIDGDILTFTEDLLNTYTVAGQVLRIDAFGLVSLAPAGEGADILAMVLQSAHDLGGDIWYLTFTKTIKEVNADNSGVSLTGVLMLKGARNDGEDVNVREINWGYF